MLSADSYVLPRSAAGLPAKLGTFLPKQTLNKQADRPPPLEGRGYGKHLGHAHLGPKLTKLRSAD